MATPHVAGAAALLRAQNPALTVADLRAIILNNVDPIPAMNGITFTGGRLNVNRALAQVPIPPVFFDGFDRTTGLGSDWRVYYGSFITNGFEAISQGTAGTGKWAGVTANIGTNDYSVQSILRVPAGTAYSGIIARGNSADISTEGYAVQLAATNGNVNLYRRSPGGVWTLLSSAAAGVAANTNYTVMLKVSGSNPVNLEVHFQGNLLFTYADSAANRILSGIPGIQNYDPNVAYDNYTVQSVGSAPPPPGPFLFDDQFNRSATGLGADWQVHQGSFNVNGTHAVSTGAQNWARIAPNLNTNDYRVKSAMIVPAGSAFSGIVARGNPTALYNDLYAVQLSETGDKVNLYRRNAGTWTLLKSASATISAGQEYPVELKVVGTNPVSLEVFFQGSLLYSYSDTAANRILSGAAGIQNYNSDVRYNFFTVTNP